MKRFLPWILVAFCFVCLAGGLIVPKSKTGFNIHEFSRLPVLANGRLKPLDTLARNSLLIIRGKQSFKTEDGRRLQPIEWLMDTLLNPSRAD